MKKILLLLFIGIVLSACGSDNESTVNNSGANESGDDVENENNEEEKATSDPLEFITDGDVLLEDGANLYELKNIYVSDDTDSDGFNVYEDNGLEIRYALVETENVADVEMNGDQEIQIMGEVINNTDYNAYFDERLSIKTDEEEQSDVSFGFNGAGEANQRSKFIDKFPLEYDMPESFTLTLVDPLIQDLDEAFEGYIEENGIEESDDWEKEIEEFRQKQTVIDQEFHKE